MKQYLLFGGESFYAEGGANDFIASFNSVSEATSAGIALHERSMVHMDDYYTNAEWCHVVDRDTMLKVWSTENSAHGGDRGPWAEKYLQECQKFRFPMPIKSIVKRAGRRKILGYEDIEVYPVDGEVYFNQPGFSHGFVHFKDAVTGEYRGFCGVSRFQEVAEPIYD